MLRNLERQRLDRDLGRDVREDPALADADRLADERHLDRCLDRLVEPDFLQVDVDDRSAHLVALALFEDGGVYGCGVVCGFGGGVARPDPGAGNSRSPIANATGCERP
jgi:hypothetical protein